MSEGPGFETSEEVGELATALAMAQGEISGARKDGVNDSYGGHRYAGLSSVWDACRAPLANNGLSVVQLPMTTDGLVGVTTMLLHKSGQWIRGYLWGTPEGSNPHALMSCITYFRRTALAAMAGVAPGDDDDGNAAAGKSEAYGPPRPAPASTPRPNFSGAADIKHDGIRATQEQLDKLDAARHAAGGKWCTDESDPRTGWRQILRVYRNEGGERITRASSLSGAQWSHLMLRIGDYATKQAANLRPIDIGALPDWATKPPVFGALGAGESSTLHQDLSALGPGSIYPSGFNFAVEASDIYAAIDNTGEGMTLENLCAIFGVDLVSEIPADCRAGALALVLAYGTPRYEAVLAKVAPTAEGR